MVLNTLPACLMAYSSDYGTAPSKNESYLFSEKQNHTCRLIEHKIIDKIYDVYLVYLIQEDFYTAYICSKNENQKPIGWEILEYNIANRLFPILKEHKEKYAEFLG